MSFYLFICLLLYVYIHIYIHIHIYMDIYVYMELFIRSFIYICSYNVCLYVYYGCRYKYIYMYDIVHALSSLGLRLQALK